MTKKQEEKFNVIAGTIVFVIVMVILNIAMALSA